MSTTAVRLTTVSGHVAPGEEPVRTLSRNSATVRGAAFTNGGNQPTDGRHDGKARPAAALSLDTNETVPA